MSEIDDRIKAEKLYIKEATEAVEKKEDKDYYSKKRKGYTQATAAADTDEKKALLLYDLIRTRNELTFLLFRYGKLTETLEQTFRTLPAIEDAIESYKSFTDARNKRYEEESKKMQEIASEEREMEVFKGVLGGLSIEDARAKQKQYEDQIKASMGGK